MAFHPKRLSFAREYARLASMGKANGTQAAIAAGYAPTGASVRACLLLADAKVLDDIAIATREIEEKRALGKVDIARMWKEAATVDRNELMEVRRPCCRFCWGAGNLYQETPNERRTRYAQHQVLLAKTKESEWVRLPAFDEMGGVGYDRRRDPNPECPECWGDGDVVVIIRDTRKISQAARNLYEGVKITQTGIELKVMDRAKAIENYAQHLGMLRSDHVHMNPDGSALGPTHVTFVAVKASRGG